MITFHWSRECVPCVTRPAENFPPVVSARSESPTSATMSWDKSPVEIHDQILTHCCISIISEYTSPDLKPRSEPSSRAGPYRHHPQVLSHYASLIGVCRSFYHIITNAVIFNKQTMPEILMKLQYDKVKTAPYTTTRPVRVHLSNPDTMASYITQSRSDLRLLIRSAGPFWNNPLVLKDLSPVEWLSPIQIPYCLDILHKLFENWARDHPKSAINRSDRVIFSIQSTPGQNVTHLGFLIGSSNQHADGWQVCSIAGALDMTSWELWGKSDVIEPELLPALRPQDMGGFQREIPLLKDIASAPPDTWWLLINQRNHLGLGSPVGFPNWYIWDSERTARYYASPSVRQSFSLVAKETASQVTSPQ